MIDFQVVSLPAASFEAYFTKDKEELKAVGALRMTVDKASGYPCRISLENAKLGEEVILLTYQHHDVDSPYRASGPIFVRQGQAARQWGINEVPPVLPGRLLSLRGYDAAGIMKDATAVDGTAFAETVSQIFENPAIEYIHVHNAKFGCYSCAVQRATQTHNP